MQVRRRRTVFQKLRMVDWKKRRQQGGNLLDRTVKLATIFAIGFGVFEYFHNVYPVFRDVEQLKSATKRVEDLEVDLDAKVTAAEELKQALDAVSATAMELEEERDALLTESTEGRSRVSTLEHELESVAYQAVYSHALMIVQDAASSAILQTLSSRSDSMFDLNRPGIAGDRIP